MKLIEKQWLLWGGRKRNRWFAIVIGEGRGRIALRHCHREWPVKLLRVRMLNKVFSRFPFAVNFYFSNYLTSDSQGRWCDPWNQSSGWAAGMAVTTNYLNASGCWKYTPISLWTTNFRIFIVNIMPVNGSSSSLARLLWARTGANWFSAWALSPNYSDCPSLRLIALAAMHSQHLSSSCVCVATSSNLFLLLFSNGLNNHSLKDIATANKNIFAE